MVPSPFPESFAVRFSACFDWPCNHVGDPRLQFLKCSVELMVRKPNCVICYSKPPASVIVDARSPNPFRYPWANGDEAMNSTCDSFSRALAPHTIPLCMLPLLRHNQATLCHICAIFVNLARTYRMVISNR